MTLWSAWAPVVYNGESERFRTETTSMKAPQIPELYGAGPSAGSEEALLLDVLVVHLRKSRVRLCEDWKRRIEDEELFTLENRESILAGTLPALDDYVEALATGR